MTRKLALLAVLALAGAGAGAAQAQFVDVIEIRQAGQDMLAGTFAGIRAVSAAKGDVKTLEVPAKNMARWIKGYPSLFPKGTEQGHNTRALPTIWSDSAGFQKAADNLAAAADHLSQLAKAGDADGVATQIKVVSDACGACHTTYRAK